MSVKSWPTALAAVVGSLAVLFIFGAMPWMGGVCDSSKIEAGKPLVDGVGGCIEFWLNRYQALASALLAFGVAAVAAYLVWGQLKANQIQARAAAVGATIDRYEFWGKYYDEVLPVYDALMKLGQYTRAMQRYHDTDDEEYEIHPDILKNPFAIYAYRARLNAEIDVLRNIAPRLRFLKGDRQRFIHLIVKYEDLIDNYAREFQYADVRSAKIEVAIDAFIIDCQDVFLDLNECLKIVVQERDRAQAGIEGSRYPLDL
ncbi:hypothetical protein [Methylobacterium sp. 17Sr1-1]|uniref:hypothetical protein n=1 Tax=Methylobacterium sp. 17Sr1-1 TaxID=2202826 RepID=UPI0013A53B20|nr:hypothetical protein [Methylobacterium sp. 17Sr1-1]